MRIVGALGVALAGLFVVGAVTAYGQLNTHAQYSGTTAAVVDDKGNLGPLIKCWALGQWLKTTVRDQSSCT